MLRRFWGELYLSVTDFGFYRTVFDQPFRKSLHFLLFLSASLALVLTLVYAWRYNPEVDKFFRWAEVNLPPIEILHGELAVLAEQPLVRKYRSDMTWTFVFDTQGTYDDPVGLEEPVLLFTRDKFFFRIQGQTQTYGWDEFGEVRIDPKNLPDYKQAIKWLYFPTAYSFFLILSLLAKPLQAIILSPLAYSVGVSYGVRFTFKNVFTIALYSLVPAIVIDIGVRMTGVEISYFDLIYLVIGGIYTFLAAQRCALID